MRVYSDYDGNMEKLLAFWKRQATSGQYAIGTFAIWIAGFTVKGILWILEQVASAAFSKILEDPRADALFTKIGSAVNWLSSVIQLVLFDRAVLGALALAMAILFLPPLWKHVKRLVVIIGGAWRVFSVRAGRHDHLGKLAARAFPLISRAMDILADYHRMSDESIHRRMQRGSNEELHAAWEEENRRLSEAFRVTMERFRREVHLEAQYVLREMIAFGYIDRTRVVDHVVNTFCINETVSRLAEGANRILADLEAQGRDVRKYRPENMQAA